MIMQEHRNLWVNGPIDPAKFCLIEMLFFNHSSDLYENKTFPGIWCSVGYDLICNINGPMGRPWLSPTSARSRTHRVCLQSVRFLGYVYHWNISILIVWRVRLLDIVICQAALGRKPNANTYSGPLKGLKIWGGGARSNIVGIMFPPVEIGSIYLPKDKE